MRLRRPSAREIEAVLRSAEHSFSYPQVGKTAELGSPAIEAAIASRYDLDRHRFPLGRGRGAFERARAALLAWRHFAIPWLELHGAHDVASGQVVATLTSVAGLWFLNPCRVVYVESAPDRDAASFAYGTLFGHAECGEERFQVSFDAATQEVSYEITAFSRPAVVWTKLGYPLARRIQKRFALSSGEALVRAVA